MSGKFKLQYCCSEIPCKSFVMMAPKDITCQQALDLISKKQSANYIAIFIDGSQISNDDQIYDYWTADTVFYATTTDEPPTAKFIQNVLNSKARQRSMSKQDSPNPKPKASPKSFAEYLERIKEVQKQILAYIDDDQDSSNNYQLLIDSFQNYQIQENNDDIRLIINCLATITQNHHRTSNFYEKIEKVLLFFKDQIKQAFSNSDLFNSFKYNKMFLLILLNNNLFYFDQAIFEQLRHYEFKNMNYIQFFAPELKQFLGNEFNDKLPDDFEEKRKIGENDDYISELIRKDSVQEFIAHFNKTGFSLSNTKIEKSIFETNTFLHQKYDKELIPTLIEYAVFNGSIQIFRFLIQNSVGFKQSLWMYAIHGNNPQIIHILEENKVTPIDASYEECFIESIKCHHNEFATYIKDNYFYQNLNMKELTKSLDDAFSDHLISLILNYNDYLKGERNIYCSSSIKYYNFYGIANELNGPEFNDLCGYDYVHIVDYLLKEGKFDLNQTIILKNDVLKIKFEIK